MEELDKRYKKKLERNSSTTPSKPRAAGRVAVSLPPHKCPKWAIADQWEPPDPDLTTGMSYLLEISEFS